MSQEQSGGASPSPYGSNFQIGVARGNDGDQGQGAPPPQATGGAPSPYASSPYGSSAPYGGGGAPYGGASPYGAPPGSPYGSSSPYGGPMGGAPYPGSGGYPPMGGGYPPMGGGYPGASPYPPMGGGYGPGASPYPPQPGGGYPPGAGAYGSGMPPVLNNPYASTSSPYASGPYAAPAPGGYGQAPAQNPYGAPGAGNPYGGAPGYGQPGGPSPYAPQGEAAVAADGAVVGDGRDPTAAPYGPPGDANKGMGSTALMVGAGAAGAVGTAALIGGAAIIGYGLYQHFTNKGATLKAGDTVDVPSSDRIKVILNWVPSKKVADGDGDLDLSAVAFDDDLKETALCYFDRRRELYGALQLSEDVRKARGLDEHLTANLVKLDDLEVKYLAFNVTSFKGVPFSLFKEATIRMQDADGSLIFRFPLENIGNHTAASLGRLIRVKKNKWIFQAFGLPLDGIVPHKLQRFYPWLYSEEFIKFPTNMYIYLIGARDLTAMDSNGKSDPWALMGLKEVEEPKQAHFKRVVVRGLPALMRSELTNFLNNSMQEKGWVKTKHDLIDDKKVSFIVKETNAHNRKGGGGNRAVQGGHYVVPVRTEWHAQRVASLSGIKFIDEDGVETRLDIVREIPQHVVPASPTKKTDVKKKTLNPKWKECLELEVPMRFFFDDHLGYIEIEVYDQDGFISKSHESMGYCRIPFYTAFRDAFERRKRGDKEYSTEAREYEMNKGSGFLKVKVGFQKPSDDCGFRLK